MDLNIKPKSLDSDLLRSGWTRTQTLNLIREYKKYPLLWKYSHPNYPSTHKKDAARMKICEALQTHKPGVTVAEIKTKTKILHQQMQQEKKKIAAFMKKSPDELYEPSLWCFQALSFLLNANESSELGNDDSSAQSDINFPMEQSETEMDAEPEIITEHKSTASTLPPLRASPLREVTKQKIKVNNEAIEELRYTAAKSIELMNFFIKTRIEERKKEESKEETFCRMLCAELKTFKDENTYDQVTADLFAIVRQAKANERASYAN